jgi:hypothetical protein
MLHFFSVDTKVFFRREQLIFLTPFEITLLFINTSVSECPTVEMLSLSYLKFLRGE